LLWETFSENSGKGPFVSFSNLQIFYKYAEVDEKKNLPNFVSNELFLANTSPLKKSALHSEDKIDHKILVQIYALNESCLSLYIEKRPNWKAICTELEDSTKIIPSLARIQSVQLSSSSAEAHYVSVPFGGVHKNQKDVDDSLYEDSHNEIYQNNDGRPHPPNTQKSRVVDEVYHNGDAPVKNVSTKSEVVTEQNNTLRGDISMNQQDVMDEYSSSESSGEPELDPNGNTLRGNVSTKSSALEGGGSIKPKARTTHNRGKNNDAIYQNA
jgi:hypothetical protein